MSLVRVKNYYYLKINNIKCIKMIIKKYEDKLKNEWEIFINNESINGTIYHTRNFLDYHPKDRFIDTSILIYEKNNLICVVPCCKNGEYYFSHLGTTYGGPVFCKKSFSIDKMKILIDLILDYYDNKFECRLANNFYFDKDIFHIYYLLSQKLKMKLELSWYINLEKTNILKNIKNKYNKKKINQIIHDNDLQFIKNDEYNNFYKILYQNLYEKHSITPTHTFKELIELKNRLKNKQKLFLIKKNNIIYSGVFVIEVTKQCWYTFYITRNIKIKDSGIYLIYLMSKICEEAKCRNIKYLDFGITTEKKGDNLNLGLSKFKQDSLSSMSNSRYLFVKY